MRELLEMSVIVSGKVQGVGFRATTKRCAQLLKITGFVSNLPDGNVEICAQGEKSTLEELLSKLAEEFNAEFQVEYLKPRTLFTHFIIKD